MTLRLPGKHNTLKRERSLPSLMRYRVVLEYDPETRHYAATVPGLPGLFVDAKSEAEALKLVREGIAWFVEELAAARKPGAKRVAPPSAKILTVDV